MLFNIRVTLPAAPRPAWCFRHVLTESSPVGHDSIIQPASSWDVHQLKSSLLQTFAAEDEGE